MRQSTSTYTFSSGPPPPTIKHPVQRIHQIYQGPAVDCWPVLKVEADTIHGDERVGSLTGATTISSAEGHESVS